MYSEVFCQLICVDQVRSLNKFTRAKRPSFGNSVETADCAKIKQKDRENECMNEGINELRRCSRGQVSYGHFWLLKKNGLQTKGRTDGHTLL